MNSLGLACLPGKIWRKDGLEAIGPAYHEGWKAGVRHAAVTIGAGYAAYHICKWGYEKVRELFFGNDNAGGDK